MFLLQSDALRSRFRDTDHTGKSQRSAGTFRPYAYNYLKIRPSIHDRMTLIVRQLSLGPEGLRLFQKPACSGLANLDSVVRIK